MVARPKTIPRAALIPFTSYTPLIYNFNIWKNPLKSLYCYSLAPGNNVPLGNSGRLPLKLDLKQKRKRSRVKGLFKAHKNVDKIDLNSRLLDRETTL